MKPRRPWRRALSWLGILALVFVITLASLRVFCLRVYKVTTASMEPTIHGAAKAQDAAPAFDGQSVLVAFGPLFDPADIERFDLVVIDRGEGTAPFVKRICGLPGERLQLSGGDLFVNGKRLAATARRPPEIELFDATRDDLEDSFHYAHSEDGGPWSSPDPEVSMLDLDATDIAPGSDRGMALFMSELADDLRLGNGALQRGTHQVNDGAIAFDVRLLAPATAGHIRARLVEEGDVFEAELAFEPSGLTARILRYPSAEVLASAFLPTLNAPGSLWTHLRFENRDNHLTLELRPPDPAADPHLHLEVDYQTNHPFEAVLPPGLSSIAPRAAFGGDGLKASFRSVRITRDLFWIPTGTWGSRPQIDLGPTEYFALGDNSANSMDSRYWGPIQRDQIIGKPLAIVGPWTQRHWL